MTPEPTQHADTVAPWDRFPIPRYAMLDVWMALGGELAAFELMMTEPGRTPADTWAQLLAAVREDVVALLADTNPPMGPQFAMLMHTREWAGS